jgi:hypothetical protein
MSKEADNKAIVGRWFTDFWGKTCNLGIVDHSGAGRCGAHRNGRENLTMTESENR